MTGNSPGSPGGSRDTARWRFGEAELDELALELSVRGTRIDIERKPLELLMLLLRHPGEVLTKEELTDALWAGRIVSESVLTKCVAKLRAALDDEDQSQIKTVHGYGYRFMVPVARLSYVAPSQPPPSGLKEGDQPPLRPNWRLVRPFTGARGENWLAEHIKTREPRVFKMATNAEGLAQIKREITLHRLIRDTLGQRDDLVRVLDWNLEEAPYFLEVEYCAGGTLADYFQARGGADAVPLSVRLDLVARTADALAACHSVGVLHKDLKPGNIFIESNDAGEPTVRLGDFGSGRVLDPDRLRALDITRLGFTQTVTSEESTSGTWAYLAPEVVAGQPPTVQSDIYSLGVLLYQTVIGDLRRPLAPGWERDIGDELLREDIAAAADTDAARRLADASELARRLRTLDARRSERERQQAAAAESERTRRTLERAQARRGWLLATTGVSLAAAVAIAILYFQVERSRDEAQRQSAAAQAVNEFLVGDMIGAADPLMSGTPDRSVREALDAAAAQVAVRFKEQPLLEGQVRQALGNAYAGNADLANATEQLRRATQLLDGANAAADARLQVRIDLATALGSGEQLDAAHHVMREALALEELSEKALVRRDKAAAWLERIAGRNATALEALEQTLPRTAAVFGADSLEYADSMMKVSRVRQEMGDYPSAVQGYEEAIGIVNAHLGADHPRGIQLAYSRAESLRLLGRFADASVALGDTAQRAERALGADHPITLNTLMALASLRGDQKSHDEAIAIGERVVAGFIEVFGERHSETLIAMNNLAGFYAEAGGIEDSLALLRRALDVSHTVYGPEHPSSLYLAHNLARSMIDLQQWEDAYEVQQGLREDMGREWAGDHPNRAIVLSWSAWTLAQLRRREEALPLIDEAIGIFERVNGAHHALVAQARTRREEILAMR